MEVLSEDNSFDNKLNNSQYPLAVSGNQSTTSANSNS